MAHVRKHMVGKSVQARWAGSLRTELASRWVCGDGLHVPGQCEGVRRPLSVGRPGVTGVSGRCDLKRIWDQGCHIRSGRWPPHGLLDPLAGGVQDPAVTGPVSLRTPVSLILSHLGAITGLPALLKAALPTGLLLDPVRRCPEYMLGHPSALGMAVPPLYMGLAGSLCHCSPLFCACSWTWAQGKGGHGGPYPLLHQTVLGASSVSCLRAGSPGSRSQPGDAG